MLNLVVSNDTSYNYAEERRLFYVALTRTKNRVFIVTPEKRPSEFIKELLSDPKSYAARRAENRPRHLECRERSLPDMRLSDAISVE